MESDIVATGSHFAQASILPHPTHQSTDKRQLLLSDAEPQAIAPITPCHQSAKLTLDTLPTEILDNILGNLLKISEDHCHVKFLSEDNNIEYGHPLYPAILRVNKALGQIGRHFLYSQNKFVIFDYYQHSPAIPDFAAVRLVTDKHLESFNHHVVHLRWQWSSAWNPRGHEPQSRCLLLTSEIETVALYAQIHNFSDLRDLIYMTPCNDGAQEHTLPESAVLYTPFSITLRTTDFRRQDLTSSEISAEQESLLSSLSLLCGSVMRLELQGSLDRDLKDRFLAEGNRRIAFQDALAWDLLNIVHLSEKRLAARLLDTNLVQTDDLLLAAFRGFRRLLTWATYTVLWRDRDGREPFDAFGDMDVGTPMTESWQYGLLLNLIDVFITMMSIAVRSNVPAPWVHDPTREFLGLYHQIPARLIQQLPTEHVAKLSHALAVAASVDWLVDTLAEEWLQRGLSQCPSDGFLAADLAVCIEGRLPGCHDLQGPIPFMTDIQTQFRFRPMHRRTVTDINVPPWFAGWTDTRHTLDPERITELHREADERLERIKASEVTRPEWSVENAEVWEEVESGPGIELINEAW